MVSPAVISLLLSSIITYLWLVCSDRHPYFRFLKLQQCLLERLMTHQVLFKLQDLDNDKTFLNNYFKILVGVESYQADARYVSNNF